MNTIKNDKNEMESTTLRLRQPAGLSMIEMMITLTIFAVIALALADGLVVSMKTTSTNEERQAAILKARERLNWVCMHKRMLINSVPVAPKTLASLPNPGSALGAGKAQGYFPRFNIDTGSNYGVIREVEDYSDATQTSTSSFDMTFDVEYALKGKQANKSRLQPLYNMSTIHPHGTWHGEHTGEIVVMFDENRLGGYPAGGVTSYGRDLTGGPTAADAPFGTPNGIPDGVSFTAIGDMDMDGSPASIAAIVPNTSQPHDFRWKAFPQAYNPFVNSSAGSDATPIGGRVPVGVIIRWAGAHGVEERVELWTVLDFYQSNLNSGDKNLKNNQYRFDD